MPTARLTAAHLNHGYVVVDPDFAHALTTQHERTFEVCVEDGETLTDQPPNHGQANIDGLDEHGVIKVGRRVAPGVVLVGKTRPRAGDPSPEEKLLLAIFGESSTVEDRSVCAPAWCEGEVVKAENDGATIRVVVAWERALEVGDLLTIDGQPVNVTAIESIEGDVGWSGAGGRAEVIKTRAARDVLAARGIGPYDAFTQQPVEGRGRRGGQVVAPDAGAVLAEHAPWALWEMATFKSDCVRARTPRLRSPLSGR